MWTQSQRYGVLRYLCMFLGIGVGLPLNPVPVRFKLNVAVGPHIYLGRDNAPASARASNTSTCTVPFWAGGNADMLDLGIGNDRTYSVTVFRIKFTSA